jgi:hypothetical protein
VGVEPDPPPHPPRAMSTNKAVEPLFTIDHPPRCLDDRSTSERG